MCMKMVSDLIHMLNIILRLISHIIFTLRLTQQSFMHDVMEMGSLTCIYWNELIEMVWE